MMAVVVAGGLVIGGSAVAEEDHEGLDANYVQDAPVGGKSGTNLGNEAAGKAAANDGNVSAEPAGTEELAPEALGAEGDSASDQAQSAAR